MLKRANVTAARSEASAVSCDAVVLAVDALISWLGQVGSAADDADRVDRIAALERLQAAAAGAQLVEINAFAASRIAHDGAEGVPARRRGTDVAAQVGLARKVSAAAAARQVVQAAALTNELPETLALLRKGEISAWVASIVVRETSALSPVDRVRADHDLAPRLPDLNPGRAEAATRRAAIALDPTSPLRRSRTAREDRRVSIRPAPDTMAILTGFLPVEQGVAAYAALNKHAVGLRGRGDARSLGQIMADTLVERVTGQETAPAIPMEVGVAISADALAETSDEPAVVTGGGPVPAEVARDIIGDAYRSGAPVWLRRLITDPVDQTVAVIDTRRRRYGGAIATLIDRRDQTCRFPYCGAPIRHRDHIEGWQRTRSTTARGGRGLCEYHNYVKEQTGWRSAVRPGRGHHLTVTTPTGHRYSSSPPTALGP